MPSPEVSDRPHDAVYWPFVRYDGNGEVIVSSQAVALKVRWNDVFRQITDPKGNLVTIDAAIIVDRIIPVGSIIWRGNINDLDPVSPVPPDSIRLVKVSNSTDDLKGRHTMNWIGAMRYRDKMPRQE